MLYQHFKGGIYYLHGIVQSTTSKCLVESGEFFAKALLTDGDNLEEVDVLLIRDKRSGFTQFIIEKASYNKEFCLYQNLEGQYWLRNKQEFYGMHESGVQRFERLTEERVFTSLMVEKTPNQI